MPGELILIVDDNEMNLKLLQMLLVRRGYQVHTASGGEEARARVRELRPRLVLMDVQLPEVNGLQLTREIKQDAELRHIRVVVVTANAMKGDREKALAAGCDSYITKPIEMRALRLEVERHLKETA
jgi:two-component system cell cycle response regulator DivK